MGGRVRVRVGVRIRVRVRLRLRLRVRGGFSSKRVRSCVSSRELAMVDATSVPGLGYG